MDGDCFGGERGIEPVPQAEVVDGMRERIYGAWEECEVGGMLQMGVQNPANESPVYYLQTDWHLHSDKVLQQRVSWTGSTEIIFCKTS